MFKFRVSIITLSILLTIGAAHAQTTCLGGTVSSGNITVIGKPAYNGNEGKVDVYNNSTGTFVLTASLKAPSAQSGDCFGASVAIYNQTILVGAPGKDHNSGRAYVYNYPKGVLTLRATLEASNTASGNQFGYSVGVCGSIAVVGSPGNSTVYLFVQPGTKSYKSEQSTENAQLTGSDDPLELGTAVSVGTEGATALDQAGVGYLFQQPTTGWTSMTETTED